MYPPDQPRTNFFQKFLLLAAGLAAVLLGVNYLSIHPDFFASLLHMATSDQPVSVAVWSTPTPPEVAYSVKFSDLPTVSPKEMTQDAIAQQTATVQPGYRPVVYTKTTKQDGAAQATLLMYGATGVFSLLLVVLFCKRVFGSSSRRRQRR